MRLFVTALAISLSACKTLAPAPEYVQWGHYPQVDPPGFYGVNSKTHKREFREFDDPKMYGAQCLDNPDFKEMSAYWDYLAREAEKRCK